MCKLVYCIYILELITVSSQTLKHCPARNVWVEDRLYCLHVEVTWRHTEVMWLHVKSWPSCQHPKFGNQQTARLITGRGTCSPHHTPTHAHRVLTTTSRPPHPSADPLMMLLSQDLWHAASITPVPGNEHNNINQLTCTRCYYLKPVPGSEHNTIAQLITTGWYYLGFPAQEQA